MEGCIHVSGSGVYRGALVCARAPPNRNGSVVAGLGVEVHGRSRRGAHDSKELHSLPPPLFLLKSSLPVPLPLPQSEELYRRALAIREAAYGAAHPATVACMNSLASVLRIW